MDFPLACSPPECHCHPFFDLCVIILCRSAANVRFWVDEQTAEVQLFFRTFSDRLLTVTLMWEDEVADVDNHVWRALHIYRFHIFFWFLMFGINLCPTGLRHIKVKRGIRFFYLFLSEYCRFVLKIDDLVSKSTNF